MKKIIFLLIITLILLKVQSQNVKGLKDYYATYFTTGVSVSPRAIKNDEAILIIKNFSSITPENAMKMGPIHPKENEYNFKDADSIVAFAVRNNLKIRGHCLCWHSQTPDWLFKNTDGLQVDKATLLERLHQHINTVVTRYKAKIYAWDVVNEVISDKKEDFYRNSLWYQICGEDFIAKAFQWAHEADPNAILFYNDYNEISTTKRAKIISMLQGLLTKGIPVTGVGLQGHWAINEPTKEQLEQTLIDFSKLPLQMQITELDISVYNKEHEGRDKKPEDENSAFTPEREQQQLEIYKMCFELFRKYKQQITAITFWNISDRHSWLDDFPVKGRKDYPLLFDKNLQPKKAFKEVINGTNKQLTQQNGNTNRKQ